MHRVLAAALTVALSVGCGPTGKSAKVPDEPAGPVFTTGDARKLGALRASATTGLVFGADGVKTELVNLKESGTARSRGPGGWVTASFGGPAQGGNHEEPWAQRARWAAGVTLGRPTPIPAQITGAEGPAMDGAAAVALVAARLGGDPSGVLIAASVTLSGRLVAPDADLELAAEQVAGTRAVIVPPGSAARVRKALGGAARVVPARTVAEAYRVATGGRLSEASLAQLEPVTEGGVTSPDALRKEIGAHWTAVLAIASAPAMPTGLRDHARTAMAAARRGESARQSPVAAHAHLATARRHAWIAGNAHRFLLAVQAGKWDEAGALLTSATERAVADVELSTGTEREGLDSLGPEFDRITLTAAAYRAESHIAAAQRLTPAVLARLDEARGSNPTTPLTIRQAGAITDLALPVLSALASSESEIRGMMAGGESEFPVEWPSIEPDTLRALTENALAAAPTPSDPRDPRAVLAAGPGPHEDDALANLGRAIARHGHHATTNLEASTAAAELNARRMAHRVNVVLGAVPPEIRWRIELARALAGKDARDADKREAIAHLEYAATLSVVLVELVLIEATPRRVAPPATRPAPGAAPVPTRD